MKSVLLVNGGAIPHYRIPIYNYLYDYLKKNNFLLTVASEGVQEDNPNTANYAHRDISLCFKNLKRLFIDTKPDAVIFWVGPHLYMLPVFLLAKKFKIKVIHWGHRRPDPPFVFLKKFFLNIVEHFIDDAVILYAEHLREFIWDCFQSKTFVANNTLNLTTYKSSRLSKEEVKRRYGISTNKNIICMGRMQGRKRIDDLVKAFHMIDMDDVGLILVGPDSEGILNDIEDKNVFRLGPLYGEESLDLLTACDLYCLPGAIGLSIVDAFYCRLPVVTEDVRHGPEIMYLKDGTNGFMVAKGDIMQLAARLKLLLIDDILREKLSLGAKDEIMRNGHIDRMCEGFRNALEYVFK
jgi:glycosyltransferase involved in cell wall biosynthesis